MNSETAKNYVSHVLSSALSDLKLTPYLDSLEITSPDPRFGDYSSNASLILAKKLKVNPKEIADKIIAQVIKNDVDKHIESVEEKAGFINFKFSPDYLKKNLQKILEQGDLYGCSVLGEGKVMVVEYFQNNVAKPPHVGHLRSAVIGDSILRILKSQGYKAISDTHIGDWGVQFGILLYAFKNLEPDMEAVIADPIIELNKLYVAMSAKIEENPSLRDLAKAEFKKLEDGDEQNRKLWQWMVDESMKDFDRYRILLDLNQFTYNLGESFYEKHMPEVLAELQQKKLVVTGETGELYVDLETYGLGRCILVKSDGATTYHLRDFATYIYRRNEFHFFKNLYVVDGRQSHHFKQLFKVLELAGYPAFEDSQLIDLGFMSLPEGAISTRKGTTISLQNLISESEKRAEKIIEDKNPELENKQQVAKQVAIAAIKYFDLSHNRKTEIVFTWDKALSFEGNTGPYLQYSHARIHGILRKVNSVQLSVNSKLNTDHLSLTTFESAVLHKLLKFSEVIEQVTKDYMPNNLCNYLFELSQTFNSFYQEVPVLGEPNPTLKNFRLDLISATAQVIKNGLYLLGIEAPEEM